MPPSGLRQVCLISAAFACLVWALPHRPRARHVALGCVASSSLSGPSGCGGTLANGSTLHRVVRLGGLARCRRLTIHVEADLRVVARRITAQLSHCFRWLATVRRTDAAGRLRPSRRPVDRLAASRRRPSSLPLVSASPPCPLSYARVSLRSICGAERRRSAESTRGRDVRFSGLSARRLARWPLRPDVSANQCRNRITTLARLAWALGPAPLDGNHGRCAVHLDAPPIMRCADALTE